MGSCTARSGGRFIPLHSARSALGMDGHHPSGSALLRNGRADGQRCETLPLRHKDVAVVDDVLPRLEIGLLCR
jgi:hypothetical protein